MDKPPLGAMPEWIWRELRAKELIGAIDRYLRSEVVRDKSCILDWVKELDEHLWKIVDKNKEKQTIYDSDFYKDLYYHC